MREEIIKVSRNTEDAPISYISTQTVAFSHYNNISAQLPIDIKTGEIISGGIKEQAKQCLEHIKAIVESIGHVLDDVIKINVFVKNIADKEMIDQVYKMYFQHHLPTRNIVEVAALPMVGALVQIDALISNGEGTAPQSPCALRKVVNNTENAPISPASTQTIAFSHYNNLSAQLPLDPSTGSLVAGGVKEQAYQCLRNIKNILESISVPIDDIVKINIFLKNISDIDMVNEVYSTFFPESAIARSVNYVPARTVFSASALPLGALIQVEAVVSHGEGTPPQESEDRHGIVIRANSTDQAPVNTLQTQSVAFSHYNHIAGQLPIDPKTNQIVSGGIEIQAKQCLENIQSIIQNVGHVMDDIVKVTIQLKEISDIERVNEVYSTFFKGKYPARTVIGVCEVPMDAAIQIDAVVSNGEGTPPQLG
ncbi:Rid family hydrolase [Vibrio sp. 99-8-1]|uniref:RidA family protein n=1 Tax=Vibrio sp. 99-8-1 TaxID=2607602 RepID=UPI0014934EC8|nr:Rid family hydrolase [Vibrio sp. 99-8-1]NOI65383.1 reactive intermediate/imine deaminase [Vibrio sp. 99-8-1]